MIGFNFGQIANTLANIMDTDYIDIRRDFGNELIEVYSNIPCHVSYSVADNPDIGSVDIRPIIQKIIINLGNWVDIRNNDYLVVKKMSENNEMLEVYSGRCGNPIVSQSRQRVTMLMSSTENDIATPPPPEKASTIHIYFMSDDVEIQSTIDKLAELDKPFIFTIPDIDGYRFVQYEINGEIYTNNEIIIGEIIELEYNVYVYYEKSEEFVFFRFLNKGLFTKDDSMLANGYHQLGKTNILESLVTPLNIEIVCKDVSIYQDDVGKNLTLQVGTKLVLYPQEVFCIIEKKEPFDNNVKLTCIEYIPTEEEKNSVVTKWYDN
jgi:hypothetical protein